MSCPRTNRGRKIQVVFDHRSRTEHNETAIQIPDGVQFTHTHYKHHPRLSTHLNCVVNGLHLCMIVANNGIHTHSLDYHLRVHISIHSITSSLCISNYTRLQHPSASSHTINYWHRVSLGVHWILIFRRTFNCSQQPPAASSDIPFEDGSLYWYIDL